jgi:hypothetical protein
MIEIPWGKFPLVDGHEHAHRWLQFYANIGRAPNTIIAYGRAVDDHLPVANSPGSATTLATAFVDHNNVMQAARRSGDSRVVRDARRAKEVLFVGSIPYEAMTLIRDR